MNDASSWQDANNRYLSDRLDWLRGRLQDRARQNRPPMALTEPHVQEPESGKSFWKKILGKESGSVASRTQPVLLPAATAKSEPAGTPATARPSADSAANPPALTILSQRLGLTLFEQDMLLLCAAMELDTGMGSLCAAAQLDPARPYPTFALAFTVFDDPSWDAMCPERPLRYWRLIEIYQPNGQPLSTSPLRADERIVNYIKGLNYLDDRLAPLFTLPDPHDQQTPPPPSQQIAIDVITAKLKEGEFGQTIPLIQLIGNDSQSKKVVAGCAASSLGLHTYRLQASLLASHGNEVESVARLWQRESSLLPLALYLDAASGEDTGQPGVTSAVNRFLSRINGVTFLDTRDVWPSLAQSTLAIDVAKPTPAEQQAIWAAALGPDASELAQKLTGQFSMNLSNIAEIAGRANAQRTEGKAADSAKVWDACLASTRPRLDAMAQRLDPRATWDDIVLPAPEMRLLHQIADQVGHRAMVYQEWGFGDKMTRGLGINALFAGESGTGKTMAAEVLANDLRLNLYRIDLSAVVSKYIGETEKNLRRLFDAAEDGGALLFFDEADALFGKRSEVRDSHDRYANIEINYLLQRMEAYRGLAILATNMKSALDQAFLRRLRFIVNLPFPGAAERKAIWQRVFPKQTPLAGLDYDRLARLTIPGGNIHNIALNAAFLAARAKAPVTMQSVLDAARNEFRKLDRPINEAEFRLPTATAVAAISAPETPARKPAEEGSAAVDSETRAADPRTSKAAVA
jgi:ATPase family associated with various cellular activities (AAA)/Winged helix domain, variant